MTIAALLPSLIPALGKVIDRVIPDKDAQSRARAELARMEQEGELRQTEVQISAILAEALDQPGPAHLPVPSCTG